MPPITLICFDLGGVLVQLVRDWDHAVQLANLNLPSSASLKDSFAAHHTLATHLEIGKITEAEYEASLPTCFPNLPPADFLKAFDAWLMGLYPGVPELISDIHQTGRKTAVLSNTNSRHWRALNTLPYAPLTTIHHLLASHLIQCRKPDPAAYHCVESQTQTPPHQILFFDDREENIQAARDAGWQAHLIDPTQEGPPQIRHHLIHLQILKR